MVLGPLWNAGRRRGVRSGLAAVLCGATALTGAYMVATRGANAEVAAIAPGLVPASLQATAPPVGVPPAVAVPVVTGDAELRARLEATSTLSVSGERLHASLLRQFYTRHGFERVWATHQQQADALLQTVMRSGEHGLDPDLFHAIALRNLAILPALDRELLLSDTFLAYAEALSRGAIPFEDRLDEEDLKPEPVDLAAALDNAITSPNPGSVIEALAPQTPGYLALRRALPAYQAAAAAAAVGPAGRVVPGQPRAADRGEAAKLRQIVVNLERQRWLPRVIPADRVWVNTASAHLTLYRADAPVFSTRVVVGDTDKQTPELQSMITSLLFNPPWNIPASIAQKEILPKLSSQPDYLSRHHMQMRHGGGIQQLPGPGSALGQLKFEMADRFDVYLHDTPLKNLFGRDNRQQSHGCVRVQNPRELAALLDEQPVESINKGISSGNTNRRYLPTPMAVFIVYQTAFADANGAIDFRPDVYERDDEIWQNLHPNRQAPVAEHESTQQRRG